jgi:hypothetical protein
MHPFWQIEQVTCVEGDYYVNHCNTFGEYALGSIFIAFNSLIAWIAKNMKNITYPGNYVNNSSGCGFTDETSFYAPYHKQFPKDQAILLSLWDELGVSHKEKKQIFGSPLTVIGINIDADKMTLTFPNEAKTKLKDELRWWSEKEKKEKVKHWYQMGGWVNWSLNMYPLL